MASTDDEKDLPRRGALKVVLAGGAVALSVATLAPAVAYVVAAGKGSNGAHWARTVKLDALEEGVPRRVKVSADARDAWKLEKQAELGAIWLIRVGDSVRALSVVCPHLGCTIGTASDGKSFACPCHDSAFDAAGKRLEGPSPRDMDPLETRVVDGFVEVAFKHFRLGTAERIEVG